ncbi:MAG: hypothetical protein Q7J06_04005 [Bacteroidales bacterium]|nr:hypothetical protein [Bacteroidales bacterium]
MKNILKIYRFFLILIVLLLGSWLISKNLVMDGELVVEKDFCFPSRLISDFYPENRVGSIERQEGEGCFQRIFIEPAYFKLKIPRTFNKVKVEITYQNPDHPVLQLALMQKRVNPLDWNFQLRPIESLQSEEWQTRIVEFIAGPDYMNDHALEFMISAPGLTKARHEIKIKKIKIWLYRSPVRGRDILPDIKNYLINKITKK